MSDTESTFEHAGHHHQHGALFDVFFALMMTIGRGPFARFVCDLGQLAPSEELVDVGCGPGAELRVAGRHCAGAVGVDPSPTMLRFCRAFNVFRGAHNVTVRAGTAENLPIDDRSASALWAVRSVHHWNDRRAGLLEALRVLSPSGRLLIVEEIVKPGKLGGMTQDEVSRLVSDVEDAGFAAVRCDSATHGRRLFNVVRAERPLDA
jgi:SAM-dependent methyltransferase